MLASADFKRNVVERIKKARADGIGSGVIADAGQNIGIHTVYGALQAMPFKKEVWVHLDKALKKLGY